MTFNQPSHEQTFYELAKLLEGENNLGRPIFAREFGDL